MFSSKSTRFYLFINVFMNLNFTLERKTLKNTLKNVLVLILLSVLIFSAVSLLNSANSTNLTKNNSENLNYGFRSNVYPTFDTETVNPPKLAYTIPINTPVIHITSNEDFAKLDIPGEGTVNNPYLIENIQLRDGYNTLIQIEDTTAYTIIRNNDLEGRLMQPLAYQYGIYIENGQNIIVENNIITGVNYGIVINENSMNNLITNNVITYVEYGVTLLGGSSDNEIANNFFEEISYFAIYMTSIFKIKEITNIAIKNNYMNNVKIGIYGIGVTKSIIQDNIITAHDYGIILDSSSFNIIEYNLILESSIGIFIDSIFSSEFVSEANTIIFNSLEHLKNHGLVLGINIDTFISQNDFLYNDEYAIYISGKDSNNAVVENNDFIENNLFSSSQVYDDGQNSLFIGNYWSDQQEEGVYNIDGLSSNFDSAPNFKLAGPHQISKPDLIQPTGGEIISGLYPIQWVESVDNKNHDVKYKIYYQNEKVPDESAWLLVAEDVHKTSFVWDTREIPNGLYRVFILAYDDYGIENNGVASNFFEIFNEEHTLSKPEILFPNGSEVLNGNVTVDWMDSIDSLGHTVYYDVLLTSNNGTSWKLLVSNITESQYNISTRYLFPFTDYKLKVIANDFLGLNATDTTDGSFTIDNKYPGYYYIISNEDFDGYEIPGSGTSLDPYFLSGFVYNQPDLSFVYLDGTTRDFDITLNDIDVINGLTNAIEIKNTQNIKIRENNVTHGSNGIYILNSVNVLIDSNMVFANTLNGIYVSNVQLSTISNNIIYDNADNGVVVEDSTLIAITGNNVFNNGYATVARLSVAGGSSIAGISGTFGSGLFLDPTSQATVTSNLIYGNSEDGISLEITDNSIVSNNSLFSNGLSGLSLVNSSENYLVENDIFNNGFSFLGQTASYGRYSIKGLSGTFGSGIFLDPSDYNEIRDNDIYNNAQNGVFLEDSNNNSIKNNDVYRNGIGSPATASTSGLAGTFASGLFLDPSNQNNLTGNIVSENGVNGIELFESDEVILVNNSVYLNGEDGISLINSDLNQILENYLFDNGFGTLNLGTADVDSLKGTFGSGIFLDPSDHNSIDGNFIFNNAEHGVFFDDSDFNIITNNAIYRNGLGAPSTAESSVLSGTFGSGLFLDPSEHNELSHNYIFENAINGIELLESNFTSITDNNIYSNQENGVVFIDSSYGSVIDNIIFNNGLGEFAGSASTDGIEGTFGSGIFLDPSVGHYIEGNVISGNGLTGIELQYINESVITLNTVENNGQYGVFFFNSNYNALTLNYIQYNGNGTIAVNTNTRLKITGTFASGLFLDPSNNNFISDNVFVRNGGYGVDVAFESSTNIIQRNDFIENNEISSPILANFNQLESPSQANDDGTNNQFAGNFYSNGQGSSSPYDIDGGANNQDSTPLDYPLYYPRHEITEPTVIFPNGGETLKGNITIAWTESVDSWDHEVSYDIWWSWDNGVLWEQIAWDVTGTAFNVDSTVVLHDGQNNLFKVIAKDGRGITAEDNSDSRFTIKNPGKNQKDNNFLLFDTTTTDLLTNFAGFTPLFVVLTLPVIFFFKRYKNNK